MHVLFVTHTAVPSGAELLLARLAKGLGPQATVLALSHGPLVTDLRDSGCNVEVLPMDASANEVRRHSGVGTILRVAPKLATLLPRLAAIRQRYDVTVGFSQKAFVLTALTQPLVRKPLIWGLNDIVNGEHFSPLMRHMGVGLANRAASSVVVNSRASAEAFIQAGGRAHLPKVVYPGVDLNAFADAVPSARPSDRFVVGCFGRIAAWKGQEVLLRSLTNLPHVEAWIVGAAQFGETGYGEQLQSLARQLNIADRVRFLGHRHDVPALMAACDAIAHTSVAAEPFGQVIVEGMAAGKPVIATAAGGALEIVDHETDGLLVPPGDAVALGAAIARLTADADLRARFSVTGPNKARLFSTDSMCQAWQDYFQVLALPPVPMLAPVRQ
ncbi:Glycosyltransferase involved in cell wall bisynthesis [Arboricoccus pini]|uniref:Glycosyltransferase involved in cell wall bisynthesis n=1 Tax=Arboricoccus pini TaxID=1963835 RepID=A0A212S4D3_9PROT|nr:glycosyltransferase family 4 protein [Arboricoccus pini]SNB79883.1 Glycosyltransferase involved in cell wall bisynthesis [Arboricoccus pini]